MSLLVKTEAQADKASDALATSGKTVMPLAKTLFSARFGMFKDKLVWSGWFW